MRAQKALRPSRVRYCAKIRPCSRCVVNSDLQSRPTRTTPISPLRSWPLMPHDIRSAVTALEQSCCVGLSGKMLLDLGNRMLSQILVDFRDDPSTHICMERTSQVRQRARRSGDDKCLHVARTHELLQGGSDMAREAMLLEVVPVGILHAAAEVRPCTFECAPGAIRALLMGWRVVVNEHAFGLQVQKLFIARVAQK